MNEFVIDNSVVLAWCFEDESDSYCEEVLDALQDGTAYVPVVWPLEVTNVLLVAGRKARISPAKAVQFLHMLEALPLLLDAESQSLVFGEIFALGEKTGLTSYDASYLALAMRRGIPLATKDKTLKKAAAKLKVAVFGTVKNT
jgi:predicted nucleic acid-binding protein